MQGCLTFQVSGIHIESGFEQNLDRFQIAFADGVVQGCGFITNDPDT